MNNKTVIGIFASPSQARKAFEDLRDAGFANEHFGILGRNEDVRYEVTGASDGNAAVTGAATGAATGAGVGLLWGLGVAANLIPAIGPVIAGGTFAALAASAATGAATAGVAGALIGWGIPEEHAAHYESKVKSGRILLTVNAGGRYAEAETIIRKAGGDTRIPTVANV